MLSNDACASTHCRFDQFATADARLPFQPAICLRGFYVDISLAGLLGVRPSNRVRWRWNDDPCVHGMTENRTVGWMAIIGSIGSELVDLIIDLIKQRRQLRDTAGFLICQAMCDDLATAGINSQMQLSSAAPGGRQTKDARIRVQDCSIREALYRRRFIFLCPECGRYVRPHTIAWRLTRWAGRWRVQSKKPASSSLRYLLAPSASISRPSPGASSRSTMLSFTICGGRPITRSSHQGSEAVGYSNAM